MAPAGTQASDFKFELKRAESSDWFVLADGSSDTLRGDATVAGHFDLRAVATVDGQQIVSPPKPVEIEFPSAQDIASNQTVEQFMKAAWRGTLHLANRRTRREEGFWIQLDTCTDSYQHTPTVLGPKVGPQGTGSVGIGSRPPDSPTDPQPTGCATYTVASFHTHTPTKFRPVGRPVGPSGADNRSDREDDAVGLAFDYIASPLGSGDIPAHYPLHGAAKVYFSGPHRRSTPP